MLSSPDANPPCWLPKTRVSPWPKTSEEPWTWTYQVGESALSGALLECYSQACPAAERTPAAELCQICPHGTAWVVVVQQKGTWLPSVRFGGRPDAALGCPSAPFSSVVLLLLLCLHLVYTPMSSAFRVLQDLTLLFPQYWLCPIFFWTGAKQSRFCEAIAMRWGLLNRVKPNSK